MTSSKLTPVEIWEYKRSWISEAVAVTLHSDLRSQGIEWCKRTLNPLHHQMTKYTNVYEDTFYFRNQKAANGFKAQFPDYTDLDDIDNGQFKR